MKSYEPKHLEKWSLPSHYFGEVWPEYYVFLRRNRDSDVLENCNFQAGNDEVDPEETGEGLDGIEDAVVIVRENHFLCGWVEWIGIHQDATKTLRAADEIAERLEGYSILDEELLSEMEGEEADKVWKNCYSWQERIEYVRNYRSQFEFADFKDMMGCIRGNYFLGYASDLIY